MTKKEKILDLFKAGKTADEIVAETGDRPEYVKYILKGVTTSKVKKVVPTTTEYISRKVMGTTDLKLLEGLYTDKSPTLIIGETGCGKTHAIREFTKQHGLPYKRLNLNGGTSTEDLLGQFVPNGDGTFEWVDGWLTKFAREGGVLVLDEINGCNSEITFALHSITDDERTLTLTQRNGELIEAHKDLWIVATMNQDYEGTKPLNLALKDRFEVILWDYDDNVEKKLNVPEDVLEIAGQLREMYKKHEISYPISTRSLIGFVANEKRFNRAIAIELFSNKFEVAEDRKAIKEIFDLKTSGGSQDEVQ